MFNIILFPLSVSVLCRMSVLAGQVYNANESKFKVECGGFFTQKQFVIQSPGYPNKYSKNSSCIYTLKGDKKGDNCSNFNFQFLDFDLKNSPNCTGDRLEVGDVEVLCGKIVGLRNYQSRTGILSVRFISGNEIKGSGFSILITRFPCASSPNPSKTFSNSKLAERTTETFFRNSDGAQDSHPASYPAYQNIPLTVPFCCEQSYNTKRFYISSPGFPTHNVNSDCVYHIHKANKDVCRLRLHFLFFWNEASTNCTRGYLQIDGTYICGCRVGLKLISTFDDRWENSPKVLRYKNIASSFGVFGGFVVEVVQDECSQRYVPADEIKSISRIPKFYHYHDQTNRIGWPNSTQTNFIEEAKLVKEVKYETGETALENNGLPPNVELFHVENTPDTKQDAKLVRRLYFFKDANDDTKSDIYFRDVEESTYIDTINLNQFLLHGNNYYKCRMWGVLQWALLAKDVLWKTMPTCSAKYDPIPQKCLLFDGLEGYVQSPGYPYYYPRNVHLCYRFAKLPGYCTIKFTMLDFQLEDSYECNKDHVILGQTYRYCGRSLLNTVSTFDLTSKSYEDLYFVTDDRVCGRGFRGYYEQMPCQYSNDSRTTTTPPVQTVTPTTITPNPELPIPCGRYINDKYFSVEVYGYHEPTCHINVVRNSEDVCYLEIQFMEFNLECSYEYLLINNRKYCGQLKGQTYSFYFENNEVHIVYRREGSAYLNPSLMRFRLSGLQNTENCEAELEVPAERLQEDFKATNTENKHRKLNGTLMDIVEHNDQEYEVVLKNTLKDICGVIMNAKNTIETEDLCKVFTSNRKNIKCVPLSSRTVYIPYTSNKIELRVKDVDRINEITYKEVTCTENLYNLDGHA